MKNNFRKIEGDSMNNLVAAFKEKTNPIIVIDERNGETSFYNKIADKLNQLDTVGSEGIMIGFVWGGKWSTDVFQITETEKDILLKQV